MDYKYFSLLLILLLSTQVYQITSLSDDIPYEDVLDICETCTCLTAQDETKKDHYVLSCSNRNFKHILPKWPGDFGKNHSGTELSVTFSGNAISTLQKLPKTEAVVSFSCRHCNLTDIQTSAFVDVPRILRLDLSWNQLTGDVLIAEIFRGPYVRAWYEPIDLQELDLSHNKIGSLEGTIFEHCPSMVKLDLGYNSLGDLDAATVNALNSVQLEYLDLSYNGLSDVPDALLRPQKSLRELNLQGNHLKIVPDSLSLVGHTLTALDLARNEIAKFDEASFLGLKALKRLNVSDMPALQQIENSTFSRLQSLEFLHCTGNSNLTTFNLESLERCANLIHLDISNCALRTLTMTLNSTAAKASWPKLRQLLLASNPWSCTCDLLRTVDSWPMDVFFSSPLPRCDTPLFLAGAQLLNLTSEYVCKLPAPKKFRAPEDDPPRFLRPKYIALTIVTVAAVVAIGIITGFVIVIIRRRLKRDEFSAVAIRYTTVRNSTGSVG